MNYYTFNLAMPRTFLKFLSLSLLFILSQITLTAIFVDSSYASVCEKSCTKKVGGKYECETETDCKCCSYTAGSNRRASCCDTEDGDNRCLNGVCCAEMYPYATERKYPNSNDNYRSCSMCPQGQVSCSVDENGPYKTSPGGSGTPSTSDDASDYYPYGKSGYMSEYTLFGKKYYCIDAQKKGPLDSNGAQVGSYAGYKESTGNKCWVVLVGECCDQGGEGASSPNSKGGVPKTTGMPASISYQGQFLTPDQVKAKVGGCLQAYVVNPYCDGASQWVK